MVLIPNNAVFNSKQLLSHIFTLKLIGKQKSWYKKITFINLKVRLK